MSAPDGLDKDFVSQNSEMRNFPSNRPRYQGTNARRDEKNLRFFEIARVLVRFDHAASRIVNANQLKQARNAEG
jgi:hypothetical protein